MQDCLVFELLFIFVAVSTVRGLSWTNTDIGKHTKLSRMTGILASLQRTIFICDEEIPLINHL